MNANYKTYVDKFKGNEEFEKKKKIVLVYFN